MRIAITHTAALSRFGEGSRGLAHALRTGAPLPGLPAEEPLANPRARKMMSRAAYLSARCLGTLLAETGWTDRDRIGYFLGVGASGGSLGDVTDLLERGIAACNPLLAFQLMNNFALCHGAILEGVGGPNAALFSRGSGTIAALGEAIHAIESGDCTHAIAGGADEATHPVTVAELTRDGFIDRGLAPSDGAALLALAASDDADAIIVDGCAHASGRGRPIAEALDDAFSRALGATAGDASARASGATTATGDASARASGAMTATGDAHPHASGAANVIGVVIAAWGPPAADVLRSFAAARFPSAPVLDTSQLGETLAASPALAIAAAVDHLAHASRDAISASSPGWSDHHGDAPRSSPTRRRVVVLSLSVDGDPGVVILSRGVA